MRLLAQAAEIPQLIDTPIQLPNWTIAAVAACVLSAIAALAFYRDRKPLA
jgi:hypothetical protein